VGVLEITDKIVLDAKVALIDIGYEGQPVHLLQDRPVSVVDDAATRGAKAQTIYCIVVPAFSHILDREIKLLAGDEVDRVRSPEAVFRLDRDLGSDKPDL